jgi:hypothetical protein
LIKLNHQKTEEGNIVVTVTTDEVALTTTVTPLSGTNPGEQELNAIAEGLGTIAFHNQSLFKIHVKFVETDYISPAPPDGSRSVLELSEIDENSPDSRFSWRLENQGVILVSETYKSAIGHFILSLTGEKIRQSEEIRELLAHEPMMAEIPLVI